MAATIAEMVAKHGDAASEIRQHAHDTSTITDAVVKNSQTICDVVGSLASSAEELESFSHALVKQSDELHTEANKFIDGVRA